mgnify:CR=1 FL=1
MMIEVFRKYLEIKSVNDLKHVNKPNKFCKIDELNPPNFQLNKFFYKQIGKNHRWIDRLNWSDKMWINYSNDKNVKTFILKENKKLVGYYEQILNKELNEHEIAYFGILEEFRNKKYGGYLLSSAIKLSFESNIKRLWVHTCSLDHKNAEKNYLARGMSIFKKEKIKIPA